MSVWFCVPSARPPAESEPIFRLWQEMGYKVAIMCDDDVRRRHVDLQVVSPPEGYPGYAKATNYLVQRVMSPEWSGALGNDPDCNWAVGGGDDTEPDAAHSAEEIAKQCTEHFSGTFGVMQPTGDRFAGGCIDRICGSPWMGREFCLRINQGVGPFWPEYRHMFPDEEMQEVTKLLGILWQRPDLIHLHHHYQRQSPALNSDAVRRPTPTFLAEANSPQHWEQFKHLFSVRKSKGFPGHEPNPFATGGAVPYSGGYLVGEHGCSGISVSRGTK